MYQRILVAVDGSDHSRCAALAGAKLARSVGATLMLLTVYHQPPDYLGEPNYSEALEKARDEAAELLAAEVEAIVADGGPEPRTEALGGKPETVILDAASSGRYDLLLMGTRGRGRLESALLGSVSSHVAAHSPIPVQIVKGEDGPAAPAT